MEDGMQWRSTLHPGMHFISTEFSLLGCHHCDFQWVWTNRASYPHRITTIQFHSVCIQFAFLFSMALKQSDSTGQRATGQDKRTRQRTGQRTG